MASDRCSSSASWGVLYYAFAAVQSSIATDTGWSSVAVTGAFSLSLILSGGVGIRVGRHIDAFGPRRVMTAASVVAIPGVASVALAPNLHEIGVDITGRKPKPVTPPWSAQQTSSSSRDARPKSNPSTAPGSRSGRPTSPRNEASTVQTACGWVATTSRHESADSRRTWDWPRSKSHRPLPS